MQEQAVPRGNLLSRALRESALTLLANHQHAPESRRKLQRSKGTAHRILKNVWLDVLMTAGKEATYLELLACLAYARALSSQGLHHQAGLPRSRDLRVAHYLRRRGRYQETQRRKLQ